MLGKTVQVEIFGTIKEQYLYSAYITNPHEYGQRQVYVLSNHRLNGSVECTIIAITKTQYKAQSRLILCPTDEVFYEPQIRSRLSVTYVQFDKLICLYEKSCGAVIYHKRPYQEIQILLVKNHNGRCWSFPKGHMEGSETEQQTALREIKEETGLTVRLEPDFRQTSVYRPFGKVKKRVVFFLAQTDTKKVNAQMSEIDHYSWVTIDDALQMCHHENDTKILLEVKKRLYTH